MIDDGVRLGPASEPGTEQGHRNDGDAYGAQDCPNH
jgi:hypothetical protein